MLTTGRWQWWCISRKCGLKPVEWQGFDPKATLLDQVHECRWPKGGLTRSIGPDTCLAIPINMGIIEAIHRIAQDFGF